MRFTPDIEVDLKEYKNDGSGEAVGYAVPPEPTVSLWSELRLFGINAQTAMASSPRLLIAGIVLALLLLTGIGVLASRLLAKEAEQDIVIKVDHLPVQLDRDMRSPAKCAECGVIESIRPMERMNGLNGVPENAPGMSEITVRMNDGTSRQFTTAAKPGDSSITSVANATHWRAGERMILIDGTNASSH